jgi:hypothetical protein
MKRSQYLLEKPVPEPEDLGKLPLDVTYVI